MELVWFLLKHVIVYGSVGQRSRFSPFRTGITGIASLVKESWVRLGRHFSNHGILRTPNWVLAPLQLSRGSLVGERGCATDPLHRPSYGYLENVDLLLMFTGVVPGNTVGSTCPPIITCPPMSRAVFCGCASMTASFGRDGSSGADPDIVHGSL